MKTKLISLTCSLFVAFYFCIAPVSAQCYEFYGLSPDGGDYNSGGIYKTNDSGDVSLIYSFLKNDISSSNGPLFHASNGKLYGLSPNGGRYRNGMIWEYDPVTGIFSKKIDFERETRGSKPCGSLIQGEDGKLYGMTEFGGTFDFGVIFEWDPLTNIFTKKIDFFPEAGRRPLSSLVRARNGLFYGTTSYGGLFEWNPVTNSIENKHDFNPDEDGSQSQGPLIEADNGKLYGMAMSGGMYGLGVLFEWDPSSDNFCKKLDFNGAGNGSHPKGSLVQADSGRLYGMTYEGGLHNCGVLFEWDPENNVFAKKLDFNADETGSGPEGTLLKLDNGKLLGITSSGFLFEWDPATDSYNKKFDINDLDATNGRHPNGSLALADNGKIFGTTFKGGIVEESNGDSYGVLFEWDPDSAVYSLKLKFEEGIKGLDPISLIETNNGKFIGNTVGGGTSDWGTIFEFNPVSDTYAKKFDFSDDNGVYPGPLMKAHNGRFYGWTRYDPDLMSYWTLFEWDPSTDHFTRHFTFNGNARPNCAFIEGEVNKLYITVNSQICEWNLAADTFISRYTFNKQEEGFNPRLITHASNGKLFGYTSSGGSFNRGTLFQWDPSTDSLVKKLDLNDTVLIGSLIQVQNHKFYGVATLGNTKQFYEWDDETNTYSIKHKITNIKISYYNTDFDLNNHLTLKDEKLYGTIHSENLIDNYVYEWDPTNNSFERKFNIEQTDGGIISDLLITGNPRNSSTLYVSTCSEYNSPSGNYTWTESGTYSDTIPGAQGCDSVITVNLTINNSTSGNLNVAACDGYISPGGKLWITSGEYKDTIPNTTGCDSVITIYLTITSTDASVTRSQSVLTANASDAAYQWIDCDNGNIPIVGETQQSFSATQNGNYAVIVSQNGCIDTSSCYAVIISGLVVNTFKHEVTLYPNPTDGSFTIDLGSIYQKAEITLTQPDGRVIRKESILNGRYIDLQIAESPGPYIVTIKADNQKAVFKIVKK